MIPEQSAPDDSAVDSAPQPDSVSPPLPRAEGPGSDDEGVDSNAAPPQEAAAGSASGEERSRPAVDEASAPASVELTETNEGGTDTASVETASVAVPGEQPTRRVRLNPTVSPDLARPVPSIKTAVTPQPSPGSAGPESVVAATGTGDQSGADAEPNTTSEERPQADLPASEETESPVYVAPSAPVAIPSAEDLDAALEAELNAALTADVPASVSAPIDESAEMSDEESSGPAGEGSVRKGAKIQGSVQSIHGDDMFIELGHRLPGVLSRRQFGLKKQPMQGEPIEVVITRINEREGLIHCNLPRGASRPAGDWEEVTTGQTVECMVGRTNKGGLEVSIGSLRGFMPASQVELGFVADLESYVGQKLRAG